MRSLGYSLTERTSTKSVGLFKRSKGNALSTLDSDRIDVLSSITSFSDSRNSPVSLFHTHL